MCFTSCPSPGHYTNDKVHLMSIVYGEKGEKEEEEEEEEEGEENEQEGERERSFFNTTFAMSLSAGADYFGLGVVSPLLPYWIENNQVDSVWLGVILTCQYLVSSFI